MKSVALAPSCLTCSLYLSCNNKKKRYDYLCKKFEPLNRKKKERVKKQKIKEDNVKEKIKTKTKKKKIKKVEEDDGGEFEEMIRELIANEKKSPLPRDFRIDDRDIPQAPNFYTFLTSPKFLNIKPSPFAKQLEIGTFLFAEYCPDCSNKKYLKNVPVDDSPSDFRENIQLLKFGRCPKCKKTKRHFWKEGQLKVPCELVGLAGQRASKSTTFSMLSNYHTHAYVKCPSPQSLFGLLPSQDLHAQFTALTWQKAKDLLWDPIWNLMRDAPWWKNYYEMLDYHAEKLGEELYTVKDTYARFRHRQLYMYPVGPDRNKIRGTTAFQGGIDEIGLFDSEEGNEKVKMNGEEVWTSLRNSFRTLRSSYYKLLKKKQGYHSVLPPFLGAISSPMSKRDMIVRLRERAKHSETMYSFHLATWEMNPNITREDLDEDFKLDPEKALRDFGAVPPNSSLPFIHNLAYVRPIISFNRRNFIQIMPISRASEQSGEIYKSGQLIYKSPKDGIRRILALDAGVKNNHFGLATGFYDLATKSIVFDGLGELRPTREQPINFNYLYHDVLEPLMEDLNIRLVVSDRWQNLKILHDLQEDFGVEIKQYSLKYKDFLTFKMGMQNSEFSIPSPEMTLDKIDHAGEKDYPSAFEMKPVSHFLYQLITVRDNEKEVTKGEGTTDDIFRACVLGYSFLINPLYRDLVSGEIPKPRQGPKIFGVIGSLGGNQPGITAYKGGVVGRFSRRIP